MRLESHRSRKIRLPAGMIDRYQVQSSADAQRISFPQEPVSCQVAASDPLSLAPFAGRHHTAASLGEVHLWRTLSRDASHNTSNTLSNISKCLWAMR